MAATPRVTVVNPQGKIVTLPQHQVDDALVSGYSMPKGAQLDEIAKAEDYGQGVGNVLRAGAEGAARGLTFGLSDEIMTGTGFADAEGIEERKKRNETAAMVGEGAGVLGGLAFPVGPAGSLVKGVARLGEGVGELAAHAVAPLASRGFASRALAKGIEKGVGSAVEGAFYGAGHAITEDALGDPDALGEGLVAHVGMGALFGGLGGATIGSVTSLGKSGTAGIGRWLKGFKASRGAATSEASDLGAKLGSEVGGEASAFDDAITGAEDDVAAENLADFESELFGEGKPLVDPDAAYKPRITKEAAALAEGEATTLTGDAYADALPDDLGGGAPAGAAPAVVAARAAQPKVGEVGAIRSFISKLAAVGSGIDEGSINAFTDFGERGIASRAALATEGIADDVLLTNTAARLQAIEDSFQAASKNAVGGLKKDAIAKVVDNSKMDLQRNASLNMLAKARELSAELKANADIYGKMTGLAEFNASIKAFEQRIASAKSSADIYMDADQFKRVLGRISKKNMFKGEAADDKIANRFDAFYDRQAKPFLESRKIWGGAGKLQQETNKEWFASLSRARLFRKQFMTQTRTGSELEPWKDEFKVDSDKLGGWINNMGSAENALKHELVTKHAENVVKFSETIAKHFDLDAKTLAKVRAAQVGNAELSSSIKKLMHEAKIRGSFKAIKNTKTGRAIVEMAKIEQFLRKNGKSSQLSKLLTRQAEMDERALATGVHAAEEHGEGFASRALHKVKETGGVLRDKTMEALADESVLEQQREMGRHRGGGSRSPASHAMQDMIGNDAGAHLPDVERAAQRDHIPSPVMQALEELADQQKQAHQLAGVEKANKAVATQITKGSKSYVDALKDAGKKTGPRAVAPASVGIMHKMFMHKDAKAGKDKDKVSAYSRHLEELSDMVGNPMVMQKHMEEATANLDHAAPQVSAFAQMTAVRAAGYLMEKAPKNPIAGGNINPNMSRWQPSESQLSSYSRTLYATQHPLSLLDDMRDGTVSHEAVDAVRTVYPTLYRKLVTELMPQLVDVPTLPFQARMQISTLFGVPVDSMADPKFVAAMQQVHAQATPEAGPPKSNPTPHNQRANIAMTPMQRALSNIS